MFKTKKLTDIYSTYLKTNKQTFERQNELDIFWRSNKKYKAQILDWFDTAIAEKDKEKLQFCIEVAFRDGVDNDYSDIFHAIILDTWHQEHEDLIDLISCFKEERFCDALFKIAMDDSTYRLFDDENESTLRKCVHALIAIKTKKAIDMLEKLIATENPNVLIVLDMYK